MNERDKYEMMYKKCDRYGKDWLAGGRAHKEHLKRVLVQPSSVRDFGAGNGSCMQYLASSGHDVRGVEIASNAPKYCQDRIEIADLRTWKAADNCVTEYALCVDVMEHIHEEHVDHVLEQIADSVIKGAYFHIALGQDKDGDQFGVELHVCQKSVDWWQAKLLQYFDNLVLLGYMAGRFVTLYVDANK